MKVMFGMIGAAATLLVACSGGKSVRYDKGMLEQSSVIGHVEKVNGQDLIVCELDLLKDSLQVPLSYLTEELQIVKLAGEDAALVGKGAVYVSDNYILIKGSANTPCKLFYKDGKFVGNVGAIGQGPGEYTMVYDIQIDEVGQRIYLLPWDADQILAYNLEGNYVRSIPLNKKYEKLRVPKGVFKVDAKNNRVAVCLLPFNYLPTVAWVQDLEGNFLHEVPAGHFKLQPDFSNEILANRSTDALELNIFTFFELRKDTLYHYDTENNELLPKFTLDFGGKDVGMHNYFELPHHFMTLVAVKKEIAEGVFKSDGKMEFLVDKESLKGSWVQLYNDYLGDMPMGKNFAWNCRDGYYAINWEPVVLIENLEKVLKENTTLDSDRRKKLETLKASIDEEDNNYILYAKLKK